jgi:hypothetical protein
LPAVALVCFLLVGRAAAGPLSTDINALPGFHGTQFFSSSANGFTLTASVDYAVYAPGVVETTGALGSPGFAMDPSHGAEYVYAYEVFNTSPAVGGAVITATTVGLDIGPIPAGASISHDPGTPEGGVAPILSHFAGTSSAAWSFGPLAVGAHSDILFFTMPFPPTTQPGGVQGGHGTIDSEGLPSPAPEPGTAALAAIAAMCLLAATRLRRQSGPK